METREYKKGEVIAEAIIKEYWNYPEYKVLCAAEDDSGEFVVSIPYEGYIEPE